jgi:hypothetical protein
MRSSAFAEGDRLRRLREGAHGLDDDAKLAAIDKVDDLF